MTLLLPAAYAATARIRLVSIIRPEPVKPGMQNPSPMATAYDPYAIMTELETMQSERVLSRVVAQLELDQSWGKKYNNNGEPLKSSATLEMLKSSLWLTPVRNSSVIAITAYNDSATECAALANAVAQNYRDYNRELLQSYETNPPTGNLVSAMEPPLFQAEIVDRATPPLKPARPNKPLNICLGGVAGFILGMFAFLLTLAIGWKSRKKEPAPGTTAPVDCSTNMEAWLALMDNGDYARSWETAAPYFQRAMAKDEWIGRLQKVRHPLGKVLSRHITATKATAAQTRLEAKYETAFDGLLAATETVTFAKQASGDWLAIGYLILPAGNKKPGLSPAAMFLQPTNLFGRIINWTGMILITAWVMMLTLVYFGYPRNDQFFHYFSAVFMMYVVLGSAEMFFRARPANWHDSLGSRKIFRGLMGFAFVIGLTVLIVDHFNLKGSKSVKSDYIGQTWFPQGDNIEITSVERSENQMTVKGHYKLVCADEASLWLDIATTNYDEVPDQAASAHNIHISKDPRISKDGGNFELSLSQLTPGLPHVSMYNNHHSFADIYFGNQAEATEESKLNLSGGRHTSPPPQIQQRLEKILNDPEVMQLNQQGWQLIQAQNFAWAIAKFQQAIELAHEAPDNANAWNGLGWAQFNSGNSAAAETSFKKALTLVPDHAGVLNGLGQIYLSLRKFDDAEKFLLQAAPNAPAAWFGLARLYLLEGKFEQAEIWAQKVVDSGQADEIAKKILEAAKQKNLGAELRRLIEPPPAPPNLSFGPVVERVLPCKLPMSFISGINFDSGRVETIPFGTNDLPAGSRSGDDYLNKMGVDMIAVGDSQPSSGLNCRLGTFAMPVMLSDWDNASAATVLAHATNLPTLIEPFKNTPECSKMTVLLPSEDDGVWPKTFIFHTRSSRAGILQITGFTENPHGVKIRYKLVQTASAPPDDGGKTGPFTAQYSQGRISLLAVSQFPNPHSVWWRPDGSMSPQSFKTEWNYASTGESIAQLVFETEGFPNHSSFSYKFTPAASVTGGAVPAFPSNGKLFRCELMFVNLPKLDTTNALKEFTVQIGVASGSGTVISTRGTEGGYAGDATLPDGTRFHVMSINPIEGNGFVALTYSYSPLQGWDACISAVANDGTIHEAVATGTSDDNLATSEARFEGIKLSNIKEFRFAVRRFQWLEFRNVSLQPGHRTAVTVNDLGGGKI